MSCDSFQIPSVNHSQPLTIPVSSRVPLDVTRKCLIEGGLARCTPAERQQPESTRPPHAHVLPRPGELAKSRIQNSEPTIHERAQIESCRRIKNEAEGPKSEASPHHPPSAAQSAPLRWHQRRSMFLSHPCCRCLCAFANWAHGAGGPCPEKRWDLGHRCAWRWTEMD